MDENEKVKGPRQLSADRVAAAYEELAAALRAHDRLRIDDGRGALYWLTAEDFDDTARNWRERSIPAERRLDADDKDWLRFGEEKSGVRHLGVLEFVAEAPSGDADNVPGCLSVYVNDRAPIRALARRVRNLDDPAVVAERLARSITQDGDSAWTAEEVRDGNG